MEMKTRIKRVKEEIKNDFLLRFVFEGKILKQTDSLSSTLNDPSVSTAQVKETGIEIDFEINCQTFCKRQINFQTALIMEIYFRIIRIYHTYL